METGFGSVDDYTTPTITKKVMANIVASPDRFITGTGKDFGLLHGDFTVAAWIWSEAYNLSGYIFNITNADDTEYIRLAIGAVDDETPAFPAYSHVGGTTAEGAGGELLPLTWHHVCLRRSSNTLQLYLDGVAVVSSDSTSSENLDLDRMSIGGDYNSNSSFRFIGRISVASIWNTALTTENIEALAVSRFTTFPVAPQHAWFNSDDHSMDTGSVGGLALVANGSYPYITESYSSGVSDVIVPTGVYSDWGFGDPDPSDDPDVAPADEYVGDTGFGSPYVVEPDNVLIINVIGGIFGDDGGYRVQLLGDWPVKGPYRFRIRNASTNTTYPSTTFANSGIPGQSHFCYTPVLGVNDMSFYLPIAPPGEYDILCDYGDGFATSVVVPDKLVIVRRNRSLITYTLRAQFPDFYQLGARTLDQEEVV